VSRPRVVIVGAGFGGLWAARALEKQPVDVLLVDRNNYHTFYPLLYQVAAAEIGPTAIAYPVRSILRGTGGRFRMADVQGLDLDHNRVLTSTGPIEYDVLIVGIGSVPRFFGVEGAREYAFPLRTMDEAIPLRHHILARFERAARAESTNRKGSLTFVIVGGGPTGVEYAAALAELVHGPLHPDFPDIAERDPAVVLVEAGARVLAGMPDRLSDYACARLRKRGVDVRLDSTVTRIEPDRVTFADGSVISTQTVVWTAGIGGDPVVASWGLPTGSAGRVPVGLDLSVPGHPNVFVVGDLAYVEEEGQPLPQVAPVAMQQGTLAGQNAARLLRGESLESFRFKDPGMLAVIGRYAAVADLSFGTFTGFVAWLFWLAIHIAKLIGFRNRALVLVNWAWNYLTFRRAARPILPGLTRAQDVGEEIEPLA
jgi:NADH dehydrogenase